MKDASTLTPTEPPVVDPAQPVKEPAVPVAPDRYDFKVPEGQKLNDKLLESATPIFKELGLTQEAAQKLVDLYAANSAASAEATTKLVNDMREGWRSDIAKDPDMGPKLDAIKADIGRAKSVIFENDPKGLAAFNEAMDLTGAGDHPAIAKAWWKMAQRVNEGTAVRGGGPSPEGQGNPSAPARPSAAQAMYPTLPSATAARH